MAAPDVDEINKIRKAVGLPLLPSATAPEQDGPAFKEHESSDESDAEPASTLESREAAGYENFRQLQEDERRRIEREKRKRELQKARDVAARSTKLEGRGLGDVDDDADLDAKAWLKGSRKRQVKLGKHRAEQLERELAERERLAATEYTSSDLAGVKVAHEIGDFEDGNSEQILTLKDAEIANDDASDDEDVLENAEIIARDKIKDKLDLKKKKAYDVHHETAETNLLSQYDEKKTRAFKLDSQGAGIEENDARRHTIGDRLKSSISLDIIRPEAVSDYLEIKMKKPKKSKKNKRKREDDDDDDDIFASRNGAGSDAMDLDFPKAVSQPTSRSKSSMFNDDEDLASVLALSRRATLKKQKRRPEDIAKQLKEEEEEEARTAAEINQGLTLDDTTTFLDNLSSRPPQDVIKTAAQRTVDQPTDTPSPDEDGDQVMGEAHAMDEGDEEELLDKLRREQKTYPSEISHTGLEEEQTSSQGTAAIFNLLKQRGLVEASNAGDKNALYKKRQEFITEARLREYKNEQRARNQREHDRQSGKMNNMSLKEREEHARHQNNQREQQSSVQAAQSFNRDYKPNVELKYHDDDGRQLNAKEAFKHLSHQFHGKGSGKQKTEKHLKKMDDAKRRMAASVLDSSQATGMSNAAGAQSKKNKEAGVRLA